MSNIAAVITQEHAKISCNFDQVEQAIKETLSEFEGVVFTETVRPTQRSRSQASGHRKRSFKRGFEMQRINIWHHGMQ